MLFGLHRHSIISMGFPIPLDPWLVLTAVEQVGIPIFFCVFLRGIGSGIFHAAALAIFHDEMHVHKWKQERRAGNGQNVSE